MKISILDNSMHYLEDYLELLEPVREMMREKLTLMRENDLKLQVEFTQLEEDSSEFLKNYRLYQNQSLLSPTKSKINIYHLPLSSINDQSLQLTSEQLVAQQEKQIEYDKIIEKHKQLIEITTKKIHLANESHDFIERYYKKLQNDLQKFKMELEADYSGLTEILEKRFANEYNDTTDENSTFDLSLLDIEPLFDSYDDITISNALIDDHTNQSTLNYFDSQSPRLSNNLIPSLLNRKQHQRLHYSSRGRKRLQDSNNISKRKGNIIRNSLLTDSYYINPSDSDESSNLNNSISLSNFFNEETNILGNFPGTIDQRRYCFCNEMSYGDMIACDNRNCPREWFHYSCVGIITPPKGKWFCADCIQIVQQNVHK